MAGKLKSSFRAFPNFGSRDAGIKLTESQRNFFEGGFMICAIYAQLKISCFIGATRRSQSKIFSLVRSLLASYIWLALRIDCLCSKNPLGSSNICSHFTCSARLSSARFRVFYHYCILTDRAASNVRYAMGYHQCTGILRLRHLRSFEDIQIFSVHRSCKAMKLGITPNEI